MGKGKLAKLAELETFPNVFQNFSYERPQLLDGAKNKISYKGNWAQQYFGNSNPICLELACGKGDYAIALGERDPDKNFLGVDIKGARLWKGAKAALDKNLPNVSFVRTSIEYLPFFFDQNEISEIWITFPDPFPRKSDAKKRLSSERFLNVYRSICKPKSTIHFKTDDYALYLYTIESVNAFNLKINVDLRDIYSMSEIPELLKIQTFYERMHLAAGKKIYYLNFSI